MGGGNDVIEEGWVTIREAAQIVSYRPGHIRRLAKTGAVEARKVGARLWLVNMAALLEYKAGVRPGRPRKDNGGDD